MVIGTPCSCMAATQASELVADMESNPGNPGLPWESWMTLPLRSVSGPPGLMNGSTYLAPKSALKPL